MKREYLDNNGTGIIESINGSLFDVTYYFNNIQIGSIQGKFVNTKSSSNTIYADGQRYSNFVYINNVHVLKKYRNKHIGQQMMKIFLALLDESIELNDIPIFLDAIPESNSKTTEELMHWYGQFGFKQKNSQTLMMLSR